MKKKNLVFLSVLVALLASLSVAKVIKDSNANSSPLPLPQNLIKPKLGYSATVEWFDSQGVTDLRVTYHMASDERVKEVHTSLTPSGIPIKTFERWYDSRGGFEVQPGEKVIHFIGGARPAITGKPDLDWYRKQFKEKAFFGEPAFLIVQPTPGSRVRVESWFSPTLGQAVEHTVYNEDGTSDGGSRMTGISRVEPNSEWMTPPSGKLSYARMEAVIAKRRASQNHLQADREAQALNNAKAVFGDFLK
jgi:hypothetical protein